MSQYVPGSAPAVPVESMDDLVAYFESGARPPAEWGVGTEYEKLVVRAETGRAATFSGSDGIERLLLELADRFGWERLVEDGRVVALRSASEAITLEPGGQLELSGRVCRTVHETAEEFRRHVEQIVSAADGLGLAFLGLGMQPLSRLEEIEWVPKQRYRIMAPYMARVGRLGQRMMKQTAGIQVNIDYASEADAMKKLRTALGLTPILTAMFANSPISDGDLNGFLSFRAHVWTDTDADRCGLLRFAFDEAAGFEDYARYALDVPMYLIVRDGRAIDMTAYTFRRFLECGCGPHRATREDWEIHLTTLFPEARLKRYVEIRCFDSQAPDLAVAVPALLKGVFYEPSCLDAAWDLVKAWPWEDLVRAYHEVARGGPRVRVRRIPIADLARELLAMARHGLERHDCRNPEGRDETVYLERLFDLARKGLCPADDVIEGWVRSWSAEPRRLVDALRYRKQDGN